MTSCSSSTTTLSGVTGPTARARLSRCGENMVLPPRGVIA